MLQLNLQLFSSDKCNIAPCVFPSGQRNHQLFSSYQCNIAPCAFSMEHQAMFTLGKGAVLNGSDIEE